MFKVNNKDTRTTPAYLTPCSSVFIVNFEQASGGSELVFLLPAINIAILFNRC